MSKLRDRWVELLGMVSIVAGLAFVGWEIQLSREFAKGEAEREVRIAWTNVLQEMWADERTADIVMRGIHGLDRLSSAERGVFHGRWSQLLNLHSTFLEMHGNNLISDSTMSSVNSEIVSVLRAPGVSEWWSEIGQFYDHHSDVESLLQNDSSSSSIADLKMYKPDEEMRHTRPYIE
ncbi:MAG: hypothetical protein O7F71_01615 [Gammaproteobacteria bacterium]|nr:hypothetical protein [Gammaproteobacteria bacterium]